MCVCMISLKSFLDDVESKHCKKGPERLLTT